VHYYSERYLTTFLFSTAVLSVFKGARQDTAQKPEVGGQLFGTFDGGQVAVTTATITPSPSKKRFLFFPTRAREQKDIDERFADGLHYLGDWHTHPEMTPTPSSRDLKTMTECFRKSKHELRAFLMVIVGLAPVDAGLWVGLLSENAERLHLSRQNQQTT